MRPRWLENKNVKKKSRLQEERVAEEMGGKAHINSGATPFQKGDGSTDDWLISCKQTSHASFSLTLRDLKEIEGQAKHIGKLPVMVIEFEKAGEEYAVIRKGEFLDYVRSLCN